LKCRARNVPIFHVESSLVTIPAEVPVQPPFEVLPSTAAEHEALLFLRELMSDSLARHDVLSRAASSAVLDLCENCVRIGWYASDAKSYLVAEGKFASWVKAHFSISYVWLNRLRRLSTHFSRDLIDSRQRAKLGINPEGLAAGIGPHLRNQLSGLAPRSLCDLLRVVGILPALPAPAGAANGAQAGNEGRVAQILASAKVLQKRINQLSPHIVSPKQRECLLSALRPLAIYFGELSR
jgi:hypothetical protein